MKIKEARERVSELRNLYSNAIKIQDFCLKKGSDKLVTELEDETGINTTLQTFAADVAFYLDEECRRISRLVDNAEVKID